jgi:hypothetical protein
MKTISQSEIISREYRLVGDSTGFLYQIPWLQDLVWPLFPLFAPNEKLSGSGHTVRWSDGLFFSSEVCSETSSSKFFISLALSNVMRYIPYAPHARLSLNVNVRRLVI